MDNSQINLVSPLLNIPDEQEIVTVYYRKTNQQIFTTDRHGDMRKIKATKVVCDNYGVLRRIISMCHKNAITVCKGMLNNSILVGEFPDMIYEKFSLFFDPDNDPWIVRFEELPPER